MSKRSKSHNQTQKSTKMKVVGLFKSNNFCYTHFFQKWGEKGEKTPSELGHIEIYLSHKG